MVLVVLLVLLLLLAEVEADLGLLYIFVKRDVYWLGSRIRHTIHLPWFQG